jgi:WD40 repeat protein
MRQLTLIVCSLSILLSIGTQSQIYAQTLAPEAISGYIISSQNGDIQLQTLSAETEALSSAVLDVMGESTASEPRYLALSPNQTRLAITTPEMNGGQTISIQDIRSSTLTSYSLPRPQNSELIVVTSWSPDSEKVVITPSSLLEPTRILDVISGQIFDIPTTPVIALNWLPNGQQFIFNGPANCIGRCSTLNDVYFGEITSAGVMIRPVSQLANGVPRLVIPENSARILIRFPSYHPSEQRIYGIISEDTDDPSARLESLYSMDLTGNLRFEADISALDLNSYFPMNVRRILYNPSDGNMYLIAITQGAGGNNSLNRLSILRYITGQGVSTVYYRDFPLSGTTSRSIASFELSPDGRYLALGLVDPTPPFAGNLVVVDLQHETTVAEIDNLLPVCQVDWTPDSTQVLYSQTDQGACARFFENQPINRLVAYNLAARTSSVVYEDALTPFLFLSGDD